MRTVTQTLLRWAPARVVAACARRALHRLPGVVAIEEVQVRTDAGRVPEVTACVQLAPGHDPHEVRSRAALALFERLPLTRVRIFVCGETPPPEEGQVLRFPPL